MLERSGSSDVAVLEQTSRFAVDVDHVVGHLHSALPPGRLDPDRHQEFTAGVRAVLRPYTEGLSGELVEDVPVDVLVGRP